MILYVRFCRIMLRYFLYCLVRISSFSQQFVCMHFPFIIFCSYVKRKRILCSIPRNCYVLFQLLWKCFSQCFYPLDFLFVSRCFFLLDFLFVSQCFFPLDFLLRFAQDSLFLLNFEKNFVSLNSQKLFRYFMRQFYGVILVGITFLVVS